MFAAASSSRTTVTHDNFNHPFSIHEIVLNHYNNICVVDFIDSSDSESPQGDNESLNTYIAIKNQLLKQQNAK
jgi:hypothetical protein